MCPEPSLEQLLAQGKISENTFQKERERQAQEKERERQAQAQEKERQAQEKEMKIQAIKERLSRPDLHPDRRLTLEKLLDELEIGV